jgi:hypothetical protein
MSLYLSEIAAEVADHVGAFEVGGQRLESAWPFALRAGAMLHDQSFAQCPQILLRRRHPFRL